MKQLKDSNTYDPVFSKIWSRFRMTRREFLRTFGIASSAITLSPFFLDRWEQAFSAPGLERVYLVKNGDCFQNISKLWELAGGVTSFIQTDDLVVIKGNCQSQNQGYTHTGCIKGVIDAILNIPGFSGEVLICDNTQEFGDHFDVSVGGRVHNWPDHNWNSLAAEYQGNGKPVDTKHWVNTNYNDTNDISDPGDGEGWIRSFFTLNGRDTYLSYPVFESPLTPGRMIDVKNGVWENGNYTGQNVKTIYIPTLNNHGNGIESYAGITSAIKSFFGGTEIHDGPSGIFRNHYAIHRSSYTGGENYCGSLVARYMSTMYAPDLFITAAMWMGHQSRTGDATETKTVLACTNPATLDYVACKYVVPLNLAPWLNPDNNNNTRKTIIDCVAGGIGTIDPAGFEIITYDFDNPTVSRLDVDRKIRDFKQGLVSEAEVRQTINAYMEIS